MNPMRCIKIDKVTVNMCLGEGGQRLLNAEKIMEGITGQKPVRTTAINAKTFGIKKGEPIGCKVTLRKKRAEDFLKTAFGTKDNKIYLQQFDDTGNFSFGIEEHTDFPGMAYDPDIGIFGMDVNVVLQRPGYRISRRQIQRRKIPRSHKLTKEDVITFVKEQFGVGVI
ncbi:MAG TPA: 50S ribosomal protein L5 [Methanocellales archaeon]|nr:50S ribosomal protein L5 [Methanocellales archaeon]